MIEAPNHLSYSSLSKYAECGEKWRLTYGYGNKGFTWFSTLFGSAFHAVTEDWDRLSLGLEIDEQRDLMSEFRKEYSKAQERGQEVRASGKELKELGWVGGPEKRNEDWVKVYGPQIEQAYYDWRNESDWVILVLPDGEPAIEVPFEIEVDGVTVVGYIDRVFYDPATDNVIIVDLKSGNEPDSELQLGDYAYGLYRTHGVRADWGVYWYPYQTKGKAAVTEESKVEVPRLDETGEPVLYKSGEKKGQPRMQVITNTIEVTPAEEPKVIGRTSYDPVDVGKYSADFVEERYRMARRGIEAHVFMPYVSRMCVACPVKNLCRAKGGNHAHRYPVKDEIEFVDKLRRVESTSSVPTS